MDYKNKLNTILKSRQMILSKDLYVAVLKVCWLLKNTRYSKSNAIKVASLKYKVTQKDIKEYVDLIGVKSKAFKQYKSQFTHGKEYMENKLRFIEKMRQEV